MPVNNTVVKKPTTQANSFPTLFGNINVPNFTGTPQTPKPIGPTLSTNQPKTGLVKTASAATQPNASKISDLQSQIAATQSQINSANAAGYGQGGQFAGQQIPGTINNQTGQIVPPQPTSSINGSTQTGQTGGQIANQGTSGLTPVSNPTSYSGLVNTQGVAPSSSDTNYANLVKQLSQQNLSQNQDYQNAVKGLNERITALSNFDPTNNAGYQQAQQAYQGAVENLAKFNQGYAKQIGGIESTPIPLEFQQGRQQVLARQASSEQQALQGAVNQQQAALGFGIQAGGLQGTALANAATSQLGLAGQGIQGQELGQTALGTAAGFAKPELGGLTQQPFDPLAGQFSGAQSVGQRAQQAGSIQSIQDLTQQQSQIQSIFNGAEANFSLLVDTAKQGGVNDTNVPVLNAFKQKLGVGFESSPAVINFRNTLAAVRSQYAQILGGGTTTVDSQQRAEQAIPDSISLGALQSLEQQLKAEATNRVAGINQQITSLQGGGSTSGGTETGNSYTSPSGNTYQLPN